MLYLYSEFSIIITALPQENHSLRVRRDLTCAVGGNKVCNSSCKLRGWKDGSCHWDTETGAFDCTCSSEKRGVR